VFLLCWQLHAFDCQYFTGAYCHDDVMISWTSSAALDICYVITANYISPSSLTWLSFACLTEPNDDVNFHYLTALFYLHFFTYCLSNNAVSSSHSNIERWDDWWMTNWRSRCNLIQGTTPESSSRDKKWIQLIHFNDYLFIYFKVTILGDRASSVCNLCVACSVICASSFILVYLYL
jgi:hypothetical protein